MSEAPDHLVLAEMLGFVADRLMALDADQLCGAGRHERSAGRANRRNAYRPRAWETRAGRVDLKIPKLRKGSYFPEFLEPRRAAEKAMAAVIQGEASRHYRFEADAERSAGSLHAFLARPLEGDWPYLWLDATYIKARRGGVRAFLRTGGNHALTVSVAAIMAVGVKTDGRREVLAYKAFPREHWPKIHSTNPLERLNKEIKRRTNVVGIFPNEAAITRRYMTLETVAAVCDDAAMDPAMIAARESASNNDPNWNHDKTLFLLNFSAVWQGHNRRRS